MALTDRQYFTLRRLHSLSGLVPVGVFLVEHWLTNSFALGGAAAYNEKVEFLRSLPYLFLLEVFGIFLPIAFHALLGAWIVWEAKFNNRALPLRQNALFALQRVSGVLLLFFIPYHLLTTRFAEWFGGSTQDLFALMQDKLQSPLTFAIYVAGVLAASFHFGNGLWGFALHWGLLTSKAAQRRWSWATLLVALAFAATGINALLAFGPLGGLSPLRLQPAHAVAAPRPAPAPPASAVPAAGQGATR